jgi:hypothetical protein
MTITLHISGNQVKQIMVRAAGEAGVYPFFVNTTLSMSNTQLEELQSGLTTPVTSGGVVFLNAGESSTVQIPVTDNAGNG